MGLKTIQPVSGEVNTTDDTWQTVATYSVVSDCSIRISNIFALARTTNAPVGQHAYSEALHRAKKVGGTLTLQGSIVFLMTFNTGSDAALVSCSMQLIVSGGDLILQVKGIAARNISWYAGFTVTLN
jgi:uncharacterized phage infection (PIP) family protein YhgE